MQKVLYIKTEQDMIDLGELIGSKLEENYIITLNGDLGAGKTTFTKGIGKALGVSSVINSPTFTILKIHHGKMPLFHMDVYRLNEDSGDDDLEEFFEQDGVSVIEWAENISYLLPDERLEIKIEILNDNVRKIYLLPKGYKYEILVEELNL